MGERSDPPGDPSSCAADGAVDPARIRAGVILALKECYDPEIPVDIYELGLVYNVNVDPSGNVVITMTLTSPACPVAGTLPVEVEDKVMSIDGVDKARVDIVWDPPWNPEEMASEYAKDVLGIW